MASMQDASPSDSECVNGLKESHLIGTCSDPIDGDAAVEVVPPESSSLVGEEGVTDVNLVVERNDTVDNVAAVEGVPSFTLDKGGGDAVKENTSIEVSSSKLSPSVIEGCAVREESVGLIVPERDSVDEFSGSVRGGVAATMVEPSSVVMEGGEEKHGILIDKDEDSVAQNSDSSLVGGHMDIKIPYFSGLAREKDSISEDALEAKKEASMEEEPLSHDLSVSKLNGDNYHMVQEKREDIVCGATADVEDSQAIESESWQNTDSKEKKEVDVMEEGNKVQAALAYTVNNREIPDDKEVVCVDGSMGNVSRDKSLRYSVLNRESHFILEEPLKALQGGEGAKDLTDVYAKKEVDVMEDVTGQSCIQELKKTKEEEKVDVVAVLEMQTNLQEVDDVVAEVSDKNEALLGKSSDIVTHFTGDTINNKEIAVDDVKEMVKNDPEVVKSEEIHLSSAAKEVEIDASNDAEIQRIGDGTSGVGEARQMLDLEETREMSKESAKVEEAMIAEAPEEIETTRDENQETDDDMTDGAKVEETMIAEVPEEIEIIRDEDQEKDDDMTDGAKVEETMVAEVPEAIETIGDKDQEKDDDVTHVGKVEETMTAKVPEEIETIGDKDKEKDDDMTDGAKVEETMIAEVPEEIETIGDKDQEKDDDMADVAKVDETMVAEVAEEIETIGDEDQEKDDDMADVAEDVETHEDSSVADIEEENHEEMGVTETQEETAIAETGEEEPEEVEENESVKGKRKRGRKPKVVKGAGKKKEEDVCFMCFDGGDLVLCDRRGCPKVYHPSCVGQDEAFFHSKGKWTCGWHICSKCERPATYLCYTCMFSLCKGCVKNTTFFCVRGNKGLCETCMETVKLIERKEQNKNELAQLDTDDKTTREYLFKDYWIDLKAQLSLSLEELDQATVTRKGHESYAKQGKNIDSSYVTDGRSDSDSSPKKKKTRSTRSKSGSTVKILSPVDQNSSGETTEWASKELLDVVVHMRHGDKSFLPQSEVHDLLLGYIKRYNLRDPRRKSQVICDSRLQNLFKRPHVGHFEMLNLLESHFLKNEQYQADDSEGNIVDTKPNHVDADENLDQPKKSGKDTKQKTHKKGASKGQQSNLDDFAAIDMHNVNLIYLRRSLVEDLLEDSTTFQEKVVGAFVRLRISGNQKQDLYRLVQVVGTSKADEPYKVGKKKTDFVLDILNLDKTEAISIDIISNQDFTEDECKRLKQSIKCGLISRLTVGDIQEKTITLQEVRVKKLLEAEILRFSHLRDRASDMGRRKELRQCVEKLQLLKSPEERQRKLEEIPEIHVDPKMDPDYESEDEDEKEEKEKEKHLRPRSSNLRRRKRELISSPREGFSSYESWSGSSNYLNTSGNRDMSRNFSGKGDYRSGSDDNVSRSIQGSAREREIQQSLGSEKSRYVSLPETSAISSRSVVPLELSPRVGPRISTALPATVPERVVNLNETEKIWHYKDPSGKVQGPFSMELLRKWNNTGYFPAKLEIWKTGESIIDSILLTDALAGGFQKQPHMIDNSITKAQVAAYGQPSQSETNLGSTARTASAIEIPKNSQDTWSSGISLPSPTPNRITTPTPKRQNFESRWSPVKPATESAVQLMDLSLPQTGLSQARKADVLVGISSAGAHPLPTRDSTNITVNHYSSTSSLPSPTPADGKLSLGSMQTEKLTHGRGGDVISSSQNSIASYGTTTPSVLPSHGQAGFPPSNFSRVSIPNQPTTHTQGHAQTQTQPRAPTGVPTLNDQNSTQLQPPPNQSSSWNQGPINPNIGWSVPVQGGMNGGSSVPPIGQTMPNSRWGGPVQGQPQSYPNPRWSVTGLAQPQPQVQPQPQLQPQAQVRPQSHVQPQVHTLGGTTPSGWMQPGPRMQSRNDNQNWGTHNQTTSIPSGSAPSSGGNQAAFWGNQQNQNRDSGYNWNKQQKVCKFYSENGYCRKGASCNYLHN